MWELITFMSSPPCVVSSFPATLFCFLHDFLAIFSVFPVSFFHLVPSFHHLPLSFEFCFWLFCAVLRSFFQPFSPLRSPLHHIKQGGHFCFCFFIFLSFYHSFNNRYLIFQLAMFPFWLWKCFFNLARPDMSLTGLLLVLLQQGPATKTGVSLKKWWNHIRFKTGLG